MKDDMLKSAKALEDKLICWRRDLHENPELGFDLPRTTALVAEKLRDFGCEPVRVGKAGLSATIGRPGKTILLRGDMDALPIREETGLPFASRNGSMHACGHDIHTTALLGAAKLLKDREDQLKGTVKLMFQACEEGLDGAKDMLDSGILEDPKPDAALALHVVHEKTGTVGLRKGYAGASCDIFEIRVEGTGCHGAATYLGVDPINVAAHLITALQAINSREVAPDSMLVLSICTIHGGTAHNIIPDTCLLTGTIRTADNEVRRFAKERVRQICQGISASFRAECRVEFKGGIPPMVNDPGFSEALTGYLDEMLGEGTVWEIPAMTGSEDFSLLCGHMPSALIWFGTGGTKEGYHHGVHHPEVVFNESAIHQMSAVYAQCALRWLEDNA